MFLKHHWHQTVFELFVGGIIKNYLFSMLRTFIMKKNCFRIWIYLSWEKEFLWKLFRWFSLLVFGFFFSFAFIREWIERHKKTVQIKWERKKKEFPWQKFPRNIAKKQNWCVMGRPWRKCESVNVPLLVWLVHIY